MIKRELREFNCKTAELKTILKDLDKNHIEWHRKSNYEKSEIAFELQLCNTIFFITIFDFDELNVEEKEFAFSTYPFVKSFDDIVSRIKQEKY